MPPKKIFFWFRIEKVNVTIESSILESIWTPNLILTRQFSFFWSNLLKNGRKCNKLNESTSSRKGTKQYWDTVRVLKIGLNKSERSIERMMRREDGTRCKSSEKNSQVFREHFKKLYERVPMYHRSGLELLQQEPVISGVDHLSTDDEVPKGVNSLKKSGPGESDLSFQMFKAIVYQRHI